MEPEVFSFQSLEQGSKAAAKFIANEVEDIVRSHGLASIVLTGGRTPRILYEYLAAQPFKDSFSWQKTHFFWGDERCVPKKHPDSNYALAYETLLSKLDLPDKNIHRMPADLATVNEGAAQYETTIRDFFNQKAALSLNDERCEIEGFDLVLLGMGEDGHIASLFPGEKTLLEENRWVAPVESDKGSPPLPRLSLTLPIINRSRCVLFLISGARKIEVMQSILAGPEEASRWYPAAMVKPKGRLIWFAAE